MSEQCEKKLNAAVQKKILFLDEWMSMAAFNGKYNTSSI